MTPALQSLRRKALELQSKAVEIEEAAGAMVPGTTIAALAAGLQSDCGDLALAIQEAIEKEGGR